MALFYAERPSCRSCGGKLDEDGECPFCAACEEAGIE